MLLIDKAIFDTDRVIPKNIAAIDTFDIDFLSQYSFAALKFCRVYCIEDLFICLGHRSE